MDYSAISLNGGGGGVGLLGGAWRARGLSAYNPGGRVVSDLVNASGASQVLMAGGTNSRGTSYAASGVQSTTVLPWLGLISAFAGSPSLSAAGSDFSGDNLAGLDLRNAVLANANLKGTRFTGADLRWADLRNAQMDDAVLVATDLRGADLTGVTGLTARQIFMSRYDSTTVLPVLAAEAVPEEPAVSEPEPGLHTYSYAFDYSNSDLTFADFSYSDVRNASFAGASLQGADFSFTLVNGADFTDADLTGADLSNALGLTEDMLADAIYDATTLLPATLMHLNVVWDLNPTGSSRNPY